MSGKTAFKNIGEYFTQESKQFVIPNYQRGYKWAVRNDNKNSAVEELCDNLIIAPKEQTYFLQGVTVCEEDNKIILIDGQQRTITLYLMLWYLGVDFFKNIVLDYDIRVKSKKFIHELKKTDFYYNDFDSENLNQDVFYFKKAIEQIKVKFDDLDDKESFKQFLLEKVTILYITIDKDKATKTFTMMNGAKATMLQEELIKAEILRQISLPEIKNTPISTSIDENLSELKHIISLDWETNVKRSRYAREWDKWLYWWNRKEVQDFFKIERPLGFLMQYYFYQNESEKGEITFSKFKNILSKNSAVQIFKELRDLQKSFEDIFNEPKTHNFLKLSMLCSSGTSDTVDIINFFFINKASGDKLRDYAKWRLVGVTHEQIIKNEAEVLVDEEIKEQTENVLIALSGKFVYFNDKDLAKKQLLRLNVEEDNKLFNGKGRKFDFGIFGEGSLEHIHPKSKVYHKKKTIENELEVVCYYNGNGDPLLGKQTDSEWLDRDSLDSCTEHSIGNLVLLDKNENSKFNDKPFYQKKEIYFNVNESFKSRNLLHSIVIFAKSKWTKEDIEKNQSDFLTRFRKDYEI